MDEILNANRKTAIGESERRTLVIGVDFGTDSVRALLADAVMGQELAVAVADYRRWRSGCWCDASRSQFRQHPLDYLEALESVLSQVVQHADRGRIAAISIDATASTPCLTDSAGMPLSLTKNYENDPDAMFVLWKDHTAQNEADEINELLRKTESGYACQSGGHYSPECFWAKILHLLRRSEALRRDACGAVELCDWIPSVLTGCRDLRSVKMNSCVAGLKLMWSKRWGGYPHEGFFAALDEALVKIVRILPSRNFGSYEAAGTLCEEWAVRLGLPTDVLVGVGNIDSYSGAVGGGIGRGTMILNLGTSACYMAVMPLGGRFDTQTVPGIFGQVDNSILPGMTGFEAGLSVFGDIHAWFKRLLMWPLQCCEPTAADSLSAESVARLAAEIDERLLPRLAEAASMFPLREDAPLATDWLNGRRSPEPCERLTATISGLALSSSAPEIYYALSEAAAFATRAVIDHLKKHGVEIRHLTAIGGISQKSPFVMQLLADVMGMKISVADTLHTCALGSVIHAAAVAGIYPTVEAAQSALAASSSRVYEPRCERAEMLARRYGKYLAAGEFSRLNFLRNE